MTATSVPNSPAPNSDRKADPVDHEWLVSIDDEGLSAV